MGQPVEVNIKTVRTGWENIKDYDIVDYVSCMWYFIDENVIRFLLKLFHFTADEKVLFQMKCYTFHWKSQI